MTVHRLIILPKALLLAAALLAAVLAPRFGLAQGTAAPEPTQTTRSGTQLPGTPFPQDKDILPFYPEYELVDPGSAVSTGSATHVDIGGTVAAVRPIEELTPGFTLPDGSGGAYWLRSPDPFRRPHPALERTTELKLKIRELADQLLADGLPQGLTAIPLSFVNQDDFQESSSFGRYVAEQLFHELYQRGLPCREYRLNAEIMPRPGQGEFLLSRGQSSIPVGFGADAVILGTYWYDTESVLLNARLIRPTDGVLLGTGNLVLRRDRTLAAMLAQTGRHLETFGTPIRDYTTMTQGAGLSAIDLGEDIQ